MFWQWKTFTAVSWASVSSGNVRRLQNITWNFRVEGGSNTDFVKTQSPKNTTSVLVASDPRELRRRSQPSCCSTERRIKQRQNQKWKRRLWRGAGVWLRQQDGGEKGNVWRFEAGWMENGMRTEWKKIGKKGGEIGTGQRHWKTLAAERNGKGMKLGENNKNDEGRRARHQKAWRKNDETSYRKKHSSVAQTIEREGGRLDEMFRIAERSWHGYSTWGSSEMEAERGEQEQIKIKHLSCCFWWQTVFLWQGHC